MAGSLLEMLAVAGRRHHPPRPGWRCSSLAGVDAVRCRAFSGAARLPPPVPPRPPKKLHGAKRLLPNQRHDSGRGGSGATGWSRVQLLLFGGAWAAVGFAAWRHLSGQQVSRFESFHSTPETSEQRAEGQEPTVVSPSGPVLTISDVRSASLGHVLQHALRHATRFITEHHVRPLELRAAIVAILEPATDDGVHEVLGELLSAGEDADNLMDASGHVESDAGVGVSGAARDSLVAALLYAEHLCAAYDFLPLSGTVHTRSHVNRMQCAASPRTGAGKISLEVATVAGQELAELGGELDETTQNGTGVAADSENSPNWSNAHAILVLCLVRRAPAIPTQFPIQNP